MGIEELLNNSIVQSSLSTAGPWTILLCLRFIVWQGRVFCPLHPGWRSCVCAHVHPCSSWEHWEWAGGLICCGVSVWNEALPQAAVLLSRQSHSPSGLLPRLSIGLFVSIEKGQWTSSARLGHLSVLRPGKMLLIWGSWCPDEALCTS